MVLEDVIASEHIIHKRHFAAMFLWMFLGFLYISLISQWITINSRDRLLTEYVDHVIQAAADQQRPAEEVRALILLKAADLSLPVNGDEIQINGYGRTLRATVHYKAHISMPIINRPVYGISFHHESRS